MIEDIENREALNIDQLNVELSIHCLCSEMAALEANVERIDSFNKALLKRCMETLSQLITRSP